MNKRLTIGILTVMLALLIIVSITPVSADITIKASGIYDPDSVELFNQTATTNSTYVLSPEGTFTVFNCTLTYVNETANLTEFMLTVNGNDQTNVTLNGTAGSTTYTWTVSDIGAANLTYNNTVNMTANQTLIAGYWALSVDQNMTAVPLRTSVSSKINQATIVVGEDSKYEQIDTPIINNTAGADAGEAGTLFNLTDIAVTYTAPVNSDDDLNRSSDTMSILNDTETYTFANVTYNWTLPSVTLGEQGQAQVIERYGKYSFSLINAIDPSSEATLTTLKIYLDTSQLQLFNSIAKTTVNGVERSVSAENGRWYITCPSLPAGSSEVVAMWHRYTVTGGGGYLQPTLSPTPVVPGFEMIYAMVGLLAVTWIMLKSREE